MSNSDKTNLEINGETLKATNLTDVIKSLLDEKGRQQELENQKSK